ncbi:TauD/TfdA family dioxygenase [Pseudoalteromonas sp. T1lg65]|uniref:TauD/TfdA family dioxygenase n=1 Tax=Pseudoalteromonas sp. T1lg65 TaxID=2077101 RepID=UPI003F78B339
MLATQYGIDDLELVAGKKLLLNVSTNGEKLLDWAENNAEAIDQLVQQSGALVIRGLKIHSSKQFGQLLSTLFQAELLNYSYRSTPRTELRGNVYTATEYHPAQTIPQHNENAYSNRWAMRLGLCCLLPSPVGGETPLADSREVYNLIPKEIREEFEAKKVMYVRNYGDIDLPWSEVFQTDNKDEVAQYCKANHLDFEWVDENTLRTSQVNPAVATHPVTKEKVWFNQAHLFHISNLDKDTQESLLSTLGVNNLPRNSYFGDGSEIDAKSLQVIRDAYNEVTFSFPWQKSDLILVDNMLYTHGRKPFSGERKVLVGMAREHGW